ncbi:C3 and PZP-like alpha-2-macroglobulin domain-containing protein 8 [Daktulosphaira vitifoliae]|uniref:C3 and PZP-like alpha-2-macroglobulin domain-containing protein 8 n=1 Tax=Daktulosphaira vitifoliae TaxID=58002 RepID=UPI0021AA48EB|nr:C3 and PZP-like alpha-2-macroglobulin domain-containing protein 8 [Daktulosphaira vitifoliae]
MTTMVYALLFVLTLCIASGKTDNCTRNFNVVAPKVAVPGQRTAVLVSWNPHCNPKDVTLRLLRQIPSAEQQRSTDEEVLSHSTMTINGDGIIPLTVPTQTPDTCYLQILTDCVNNTSSCTLQTTSKLHLVGTIRDVVVQTSSKFYKPGEIVKFWLLPLDHDLRLADEITMDVFIKDPHGIKVALWNDVPTSYVIPFNFILPELASLGEWSVEVETEGITFKTVINVSNNRGANDPSKREQTITEEHFVELRFGPETRHKYKPGLPFQGKVEAMSSEKNLRVRVKVFDNSTAIYSQDVEMLQGEGTFVVPAVISDSEIIVLQAELVSVEGKEIEGHYVLAKEIIKKWNSISDCYLLVEGLDHTLVANEKVEVVILSSCPCNRNINYVVTTDGHITFWNNYKPDVKMTKIMDQVDICRFNLTFKVDSVMAPTSHLLVYYTTDDGETINDVLSFNVKQTDPKVKITPQKIRKNWYPEEHIKINIMAEESSIICLIGGRGTENSTPNRNTGDLLESGLLFLEKHVNEKVTTSKLNDIYPKHHSFFDTFSIEQLWIWKCQNFTGSLLKNGIDVQTPSKAGNWKLRMLAIGNSGLKITDTINIKVVSTLEVDVRSPVEINVGETVQTDIYVANNVNSCMDVNALLSLSEGAVFSSSNQPFIAEKLRLGAYGATSLIVKITALKSGVKNLTIDISGFISQKCHSLSDIKQLEVPVIGNLSASSVVKSISINVHPEGIQHQITNSAYFCANEQLVVSTTPDFRYQHVTAPKNRDGIVFEIQAKKSAHILLSQERKPTTMMYQIVLGDLENSISWIGRGKHGNGVHLINRNTPGILSEETPRTFWISWEKGILAFGYGQEIHQYPLLKWNMDKKIKINHIGFATIVGTTGQFRVWNYNNEAGFSQVLHLDTSNSVISGTDSGTLVITGGLNFPYFVQNDPKLSTSLLSFLQIFTPLITFENNQNETEENELVSVLRKNIPVLLSYKNKDFLFGDHPNVPCFWCNIRVLEILWKSQSHIGVDSDIIKGLKSWIKKQVFDDFSKVLPENKFKMYQIIAAADTLATFVELGVESEADIKLVNHTKSFLENNLDNITKPYPLAMTSYALLISNSIFSSKALERLQLLSTNQENEFGWPKIHSTSDWYEEIIPPKKGVSTEEFKASLYCLMIYATKHDLKTSEPIVRYLYYRTQVLDSNPDLAYLTVKAFAMFNNIGSDPHRKLTVSLATSGMELTDTLEFDSSTKSKYLHLPSLPTKVFIYATGAGCSTIQGRIQYTTYTSAENENKLIDLWSAVTDVIQPSKGFTDEIYSHSTTLRLRTCFKSNNLTEDTLRLEVKLFSGFYFEKMTYSTITKVHFGSHSNHVWFVFSKVPNHCIICVSYIAKNTQRVTGLRPAVAKIYPVEKPNLSSYKFFHVDEEQSPLAEGLTALQLADWITNDSSIPNKNENFCTCNNLCKNNSFVEESTVKTPINVQYTTPTKSSLMAQTKETSKTQFSAQKTTIIKTPITRKEQSALSYISSPIPTTSFANSSNSMQVPRKQLIETIPLKTKRTPVKSTGNVVRNMKKPNKNGSKEKDSNSKHRSSEGSNSETPDATLINNSNTDTAAVAISKTSHSNNVIKNSKTNGGSTTKPLSSTPQNTTPLTVTTKTSFITTTAKTLSIQSTKEVQTTHHTNILTTKIPIITRVLGTTITPITYSALSPLSTKPTSIKSITTMPDLILDANKSKKVIND